MKVHLHRLSRDLVCEASIPFTHPIPGVLLYEARAYALMLDWPSNIYDEHFDALHYQETVIYTLPAESVRAVGDAFARSEAQS